MCDEKKSTSYTTKSAGTNVNLSEKTGKAINLQCSGECKDRMLKGFSEKGLMNNTVDKGNF